MTSAGVGLVVGLACVVIGFIAHVRSVGYRLSMEARLSERLGMAVHIGAIRPLSLTGRVLRDVHVQVRESGEEVFACTEGIWKAGRGEGPARYVLELRDGWLLVGTTRWTERDYDRMLAGGLGHDFAELALGEVRLRRIELRFHHPPMTLAAESTSGVVRFDETGEGRASLQCLRLNGVEVAEPVHLGFRFTSGVPLVFREVRFTVPAIPVHALGLDGLLTNGISRGKFQGSIIYTRSDAGESVEVAGSLHDADLWEFTGGTQGGPFHGAIDVEVESAVFQERKLRSLTARGRVGDLRIGELLPGLVRSSGEDRLVLDVERVLWRDGRLMALSAQGACRGLSLDALSALWGRGTVTGSVAADLSSLSVVDDALHEADVTVVVSPPEDGPGLIDRDIIARAAKQWFGVDVGTVLPEQVPYARLGVRFVVEGGRLHVLGTHGPEGRTILSVELFGRSWGVIQQPERTFPVPDVWGRLRQRVDDVDRDEVRAWWERLRLKEESPP